MAEAPWEDPPDEDPREDPVTLVVLDHWQAEAGHAGCEGFTYDTGNSYLSCACGTRIPAPGAERKAA